MLWENRFLLSINFSPAIVGKEIYRQSTINLDTGLPQFRFAETRCSPILYIGSYKVSVCDVKFRNDVT